MIFSLHSMSLQRIPAEKFAPEGQLADPHPHWKFMKKY